LSDFVEIWPAGALWIHGGREMVKITSDVIQDGGLCPNCKPWYFFAFSWAF